MLQCVAVCCSVLQCVAGTQGCFGVLRIPRLPQVSISLVQNAGPFCELAGVAVGGRALVQNAGPFCELAGVAVGGRALVQNAGPFCEHLKGSFGSRQCSFGIPCQK